MSRRLMVPFLTEWLINYGTDPIDVSSLGLVKMDIFYTAMRKKYIISFGQPVLMKLTKEGIRYIQEN